MSQAIDIRINEESLDLPPDIQITMDLISPLFQDEVGGGTQSFSFSLPDTPTNRRLFQFAGTAILSERIYPPFSCSLYLFGIHWMNGQILLSDAGNGFKASLRMEESDLVSRMEEQKLRELSLGGVRTITSNSGLDGINDMLAHANDTVANPGNHDYVFAPIRNPDAYQGQRPAPPGTPEVHNDYLNYYRDDSFRDEVQEVINMTPGQCTLIPFPRLLYVIQEGLDELGEKMLDSTFWTDSEIGDLVIHNLISLDRYADASIAATFPINALTKTISVPNHLPDISFRELVGSIARLFCLVMIRKPDGVEIEARKEILQGTDQIDWSDRTGVVYSIQHESEKRWEFSSVQDPDDAIEPEEKEQVAGIGFANQVNSFSDLPTSGSQGSLYYVIEENAFYRYQMIASSVPTAYEWLLEDYRLEKLTAGLGKNTQKIESQASTIQSIWVGDWEGESSGSKWRLPNIDQLVSSPMWQIGENNPFSLRLLFFRGLQSVDSGPTYPQVEPDGYNGTYSLFWYGLDGLFETWWKDWITFIQGSLRIQISFHLSVTDILSLDWKKRIRFRVREGYARGFLRRLRITITAQGITESTAELQAE